MNPTDETDLFREQMDGVTPVETDRAEPWRRRRPPRPLGLTVPDDANERSRLSEAEVETHDYLAFKRPGLQDRVFHDLARGRFEVEMELDLHGYTVAIAKEAFKEFIGYCVRHDRRCLRIIHGKGLGSEGQQPILKQKINHWLREREEVLAFCSATRRDGGSGAAYVLLRAAAKGRRDGRR